MVDTRCVRTVAGETMVGHMIEEAESCHPWTLPPTALYKWVTFSFAED